MTELWCYCHVVVPPFGTVCRFVDTLNVERTGEYVGPFGKGGLFLVGKEEVVGLKWRRV